MARLLASRDARGGSRGRGFQKNSPERDLFHARVPVDRQLRGEVLLFARPLVGGEDICSTTRGNDEGLGRSRGWHLDVHFFGVN